jgi:hypothetical protein
LRKLKQNVALSARMIGLALAAVLQLLDEAVESRDAHVQALGLSFPLQGIVAGLQSGEAADSGFQSRISGDVVQWVGITGILSMSLLGRPPRRSSSLSLRPEGLQVPAVLQSVGKVPAGRTLTGGAVRQQAGEGGRVEDEHLCGAVAKRLSGNVPGVDLTRDLPLRVRGVVRIGRDENPPAPERRPISLVGRVSP